MRAYLRIALREIWNSRSFSAFFVLNLALGLLGFVALDTFKGSLAGSLSQRSKNLLSADLSVFARRVLKDEEVSAVHAALPPGTREGALVELYSMVSTPRASRLVQVVAVDETYPFYGQLDLMSGGKVSGDTRKDILGRKTVWIYPELGLQLGLKAGDPLRIGGAEFQVADLILNDTGNVWRGFSLASRVYIGLPHLRETGLITTGSTVFYSRLFRLPDAHDAQPVAEDLNRRIRDTAVQIKTHRNATEDIGRTLNYLSDYLGLVALVALFLACIGSAYLFRALLARRMKEIAILSSLGVTCRGIQSIYFIQLAVLGAAASLLAVGAGLLSMPLLGWIVRTLMPFSIELTPGATTLGLTMALGTAGSVLICLPLLLRLRHLRPNELFQESADPKLSFHRSDLWGFAPVLAAGWLVSVWQAHSLRTGSLFFGLLLLSGAILSGSGLLGLRGLRRLEGRFGIVPRLALRNLSRSRLSSISCFVAIGIGTLLLNLIPQLERNIRSELIEPQRSELPSLFLFDIQDDQVAPLQRFMSEGGMELQGLSPLIRSRLTRINGVAFEKDLSANRLGTREEEQEARFRNRGFNLSYRVALTSTEAIVRGRETLGRFLDDGQAIPEVTVERRFAERLRIRIDDLLEFDIQGVPVKGRVVGFRKVRWTSFKPNFFILFQPGVLDEAPKTWLAGVPPLPMERKVSLQNEMVRRFPNISMIDVTDLATKILETFRQMGVAIGIMALLSIFAGMIVLFSIASHQAATREQETNLMKVLGAPFGRLSRVIQLEFATLGLSASAVGIVLSYLCSYVVSVLLFDGAWSVSWTLPLASLLGVTLLSTGIALLATRRVLRSRPLELLQRGT